MIEYINHELEYVPWAVTLRSMAYIGNMLSSRASYKLYQVAVIDRFNPWIQKRILHRLTKPTHKNHPLFLLKKGTTVGDCVTHKRGSFPGNIRIPTINLVARQHYSVGFRTGRQYSRCSLTGAKKLVKSQPPFAKIHHFFLLTTRSNHLEKLSYLL